MTMHDDGLTPAERERLAALPRERMPSELLEQRTMDALRARGLLRTSVGWRWPALAGAVAAGLALFALGYAAGATRGGTTVDGSQPRPDVAVEATVQTVVWF